MHTDPDLIKRRLTDIRHGLHRVHSFVRKNENKEWVAENKAMIQKYLGHATDYINRIEQKISGKKSTWYIVVQIHVQLDASYYAMLFLVDNMKMCDPDTTIGDARRFETLEAATEVAELLTKKTKSPHHVLTLRS